MHFSSILGSRKNNLWLPFPTQKCMHAFNGLKNQVAFLYVSEACFWEISCVSIINHWAKRVWYGLQFAFCQPEYFKWFHCVVLEIWQMVWLKKKPIVKTGEMNLWIEDFSAVCARAKLLMWHLKKVVCRLEGATAQMYNVTFFFVSYKSKPLMPWGGYFDNGAIE